MLGGLLGPSKAPRLTVLLCRDPPFAMEAWALLGTGIAPLPFVYPERPAALRSVDTRCFIPPLLVFGEDVDCGTVLL